MARPSGASSTTARLLSFRIGVKPSRPHKPNVALPGWYINRTQPGGVPVFNASNSAAFFRQIGKANLSDKLQQQIAYQLDQRCRDVVPRAYRKKEKALADA